MTKYDYIVIGAGSAGCVLANRLTEDGKTTVLLLEAGNPATKPEYQVPLYWTQLWGTEVDWAYFTEEEPYINNRKIYCPRGKGLGGTSTINAMIYIRGSRYDYDHWQKLGNLGWSYQDVLPYFKKSENQQRGASQFHGVGGVLSVTDPIAPAVTSHKFVEAAVALGYELNPDFNGAQQQGAGLYQLTVKDGQRHSTAAAFLVPILERPNLTVTTAALVTRLLFTGTRTVGVEYQHEGMIHQSFVNQEVILCAGAIDSPKLLMLSGIGNAEHLQALGIPVIVNLPGVGQNLQDHLHVAVAYQATNDLQPYRNQPSKTEVRNCLLKLFSICGESQRKAKRENTSLPEDNLPRLWILATSASTTLLESFGARLDTDNWLTGVYFLPDSFRTAIIAINQLPPTLETLWLRILGKGETQRQAVSELLSLPQNNPLRRSIQELITSWRITVLNQENLTEDDQEVIMNLSQAYLEWREATLQEGVQEGQRQVVENLLRVRFGSLDAELERIIEPLLQLPPQEYSRLLLELSREELLTRFGNG